MGGTSGRTTRCSGRRFAAPLTANVGRPPVNAVQTIIPLLKYDDAPAAIEWICRHLGFSVRLLVEGDDRHVAHAQLQRGDSVVMVSSTSTGEPSLASPRALGGSAVVIYVVDPEVEPLYAVLSRTGVEVLGPFERDPHGIGRFQVRDIEGHIWSFSDYSPFASSVA